MKNTECTAEALTANLAGTYDSGSSLEQVKSDRPSHASLLQYRPLASGPESVVS
jgi:hypothetical protein